MKIITDSTPKRDGYRMPGEFEPHDGCWLIWPERQDNWRLGAKPAQEAFKQVIAAISRFEKVCVAVGAGQYEHVRSELPPQVKIVEMSSNDCWMRDCGPVFVKNKKDDIRGVNFEFNAWGGLYDGLYFPWDKDSQIAEKVCEIEEKDVYQADGFVLEGGSFHCDGEGTLLTTEECLLSPGRNPQLNRAQIERKLSDYLGVEKVIWIQRGLDPNETNGHIDLVCCFARPGVVVTAWTEKKSNPYYEICREAYEILSKATDARGRKLKIYRLELPESAVRITADESRGVDTAVKTAPRKEGDLLPASYINYYSANGGIIVPQFGDPNDGKAIQTLSEIYPDRQVVGVFAREILLGGGIIHCITQQVPR